MTSQSSGDPVPSVAEADATGEIAEIYADIRATLGMSFVNLIWRNLASVPDGLRWTWTTMKPLYVAGHVYREAAELRDGQSLPNVPRLPTAALRAVGVDEAAQRAIRSAIAGYDRGNPLNLVSFSAIMARLAQRSSSPNASAAPQLLTATKPEQSTAANDPAPRMLNFEEMDQDTAALVRAVNLIGARGDAAKIQVSLPRNLARWPGFLSLYYSILQPIHDDGRLFDAVDAVLADGRLRGESLTADLADTGLPEQHVAESVRASLENLVPNAMGRMIPVVSLLKRMLPA